VLLGRESVHAGLVCLSGMMSLDIQRAGSLHHLGDVEPINEAMQITLLSNWSVRPDRYDLPPGM
jgi:hypothetical protein